jgi:peptidoglycan/xylan/chitin deacetylase (PgdA/CDA1 family)
VRLPGRSRSIAAARWIRSRAGSRGVVLGYHRVAEERHDPLGLCTPPSVFERHLQAIRRYGQPMRLLGLARATARRRLPSRGVVVTFDDGYADTLSIAKPLLERYEIPATVFVIAGYLGREFWWDELIRIWRGDLGSDGYRAYTRLERLPDDERRKELRRLAASRPVAAKRLTKSRVLRVEELSDLTAGGLIELGAHSLSHPRLSSLPRPDQDQEIAGSKRRLEGIAGHQVHAFAYPHGDYSEETAALVREAGYRCACTSSPDVCRAGTDPFALPRFWPDQRGDGRFSRWLRWWLGS